MTIVADFLIFFVDDATQKEIFSIEFMRNYLDFKKSFNYVIDKGVVALFRIFYYGDTSKSLILRLGQSYIIPKKSQFFFTSSRIATMFENPSEKYHLF